MERAPAAESAPPRAGAAPPWRRAVVLLAAALVVRAGAAALLGISRPAAEDEIEYVRIAQSLAHGDGWTLASDLAGVAPRTSFRAPFLPALLAPVAALGGGVVAMRCVCLVLGALVAPAAYLALRRTSLGERAVWVGAALAVWPTGVYLSLRALAEPAAQVLLLAALAALPVAPPSDGPGGARRAAWAGILAGLSVLARPALLAACVLVGVVAGAPRGSRRVGAAFLAVLVLVVGTWAARNAALHGRPLLTTNTGVTLVGANSAAAAAADVPGKWLDPQDVYAASADPPDLGMWGWSDLTEEASDRRFSGDAVRWAAEHPGDVVRLTAWKVVRLFDPDQHSGKPDAAAKRWIGWLAAGPVLALALAGLFLAGRDPTQRPWLAVLAGTAITAVVFYGDTRMRNAADPTLLALAAAAVSRALPGAWPRPDLPPGRTAP